MDTIKGQWPINYLLVIIMSINNNSNKKYCRNVVFLKICITTPQLKVDN